LTIGYFGDWKAFAGVFEFQTDTSHHRHFSDISFLQRDTFWHL